MKITLKETQVTKPKPTPQGVREFVTGQDGELIEVTTHG